MFIDKEFKFCSTELLINDNKIIIILKKNIFLFDFTFSFSIMWAFRDDQSATVV